LGRERNCANCRHTIYKIASHFALYAYIFPIPVKSDATLFLTSTVETWRAWPNACTLASLRHLLRNVKKLSKHQETLGNLKNSEETRRNVIVKPGECE